jgi:hypothetical protein
MVGVPPCCGLLRDLMGDRCCSVAAASVPPRQVPSPASRDEAIGDTTGSLARGPPPPGAGGRLLQHAK